MRVLSPVRQRDRISSRLTYGKGWISMQVYTFHTVVVGSGAAGFNCADRLYSLGIKDVAIVTDGVNCGTSRNAGSDKQTYYKLSLAGSDLDSVMELAQSYFKGGCVDGDLALCEAALSTPCFFRLTELGVLFPQNRYGEYVGYKTDHDPRQRATSAGPYTSKIMTECLEKEVRKKNIPIFDGLQAIKVLKKDEHAAGLLCFRISSTVSEEDRFVAFSCQNLVLATGGPAGMYADSVYPGSQMGASGMAFEAGVKGKNLTEWQYGLASVAPRWNVSGTYMQVLPRFLSTESDGSCPREFLFDYFSDKSKLLSLVFLKGYQWPFDVRKVSEGSSIIDILVYLESRKGRRVYLDFRSNPMEEEIDYESLSEEARSYLKKAGACFGTPIDRLIRMNQPAVDFYREHGVDLCTQRLEIALCAQHNNGGLSVNCWWETNVPHLFAVGEVAGSHGVYRPGGSSLNAGQVGGTRAARYIAAGATDHSQRDACFDCVLKKAVEEAKELAEAVYKEKGGSNIFRLWQEAQSDMSANGAAIRNADRMEACLNRARKRLKRLKTEAVIERLDELSLVFRYRDVLVSQLVYLSAMIDYAKNKGKSRGSALYTDSDGTKPMAFLPEELAFLLDDGKEYDRIQEVEYRNGHVYCYWRPARPIPEEDNFFENVWRDFRENGNVF